MKNFPRELDGVDQGCYRPARFYLRAFIESLSDPDTNSNKDVWFCSYFMLKFAESIADPDHWDDFTSWVLKFEGLVRDVSGHALNTAVSAPKVRLSAVDQYASLLAVGLRLSITGVLAVVSTHTGYPYPSKSRPKVSMSQRCPSQVDWDIFSIHCSESCGFAGF